ncbi:MAG TPA: hypothetical protein VG937_22390 [Polyangiaceae bacterium]|nr:hypothetical protein [Polyangiaceae bacterium]
MRTTFQLVTSSIGYISIPAAIAALVACSASNAPPSGGTGGSTGTSTGGQIGSSTGGSISGNTGGTSSSTTGGTTGTGTTGGTTGTGTTGGTSASGATGTGGAATVTCSNTDKTIIPIDKTGWVARECNNFKIQGAWYCYDDGMTQAGCTKDMPPFVEGKGMCLKGTTLGTAMGWGAGIGLSLNDSGKTATMASVKGPYAANTNGVKGFKIALSGSTGGLPLRINFPKLAMPSGVSPFVEVPGAPADTPYNVLIADALVPKAWMVTNAGETADPASIFDLQIQLPGDSKAAAFDFCVTSVTPITDGTNTMTGGNLMTYGSAQCDQYARINVPNYVVQNNAYGGNQHCIQAKTDNASKAGFLLSNIQASKPTGGAPGSYPSIVYGWHVDGKFYGGYTAAKTLSSITSIPTNMSITVPGAGRYNASYDNWIGSAATSASSAGTLEQMIWLNYRDTTPIGSKVASVSLAGTTWDVWYGTHDGFRTVSYIRTNTTTMSFDINDFMKDTIMRGYAKTSDFLLGIQAGFEIWEGSGAGFSVDSFDVAVK